MAFYEGPAFAHGRVSLCAPDVPVLTRLLDDADLTSHQKDWLRRAAIDETVLYFAVALDGEALGQIMLHDIDANAGVALVGYHIFRVDHRGCGTGTIALRLLSHHALSTLGLRRVVAITGVDNIASRRIAEKSGYVGTGAPREGPHLVAFELCAPSQELSAV